MENQSKFINFRLKYDKFIYKKFNIIENSENIILKYYFEIPTLTHFEPEITISKKHMNFKNLNTPIAQNIAFHIGLIELISYWKCTCCPNVIIECGTLNENQINWFKKLYFYGLGELFYTNGIHTNIDDFMNISCTYQEKNISHFNEYSYANYNGYIIPIGGGKDSVVTLELLKNQPDTLSLIVNPKSVTLKCAELAGYDNDHIIEIKRNIDSNLIKLNSDGYINGHTPFSSLLAFLTYFVAFLLNKKYIALSNEASANEANVKNEKINHQYSKSFEFENDFEYYTKKYFLLPIKYFSFLRPLNELQIAKLFSKYEKYHSTFKSCNVGSKGKIWEWCCNCPKCLFAYIILSPFLYKDKLIKIFGMDLFENKKLLDTFIGLTGFGNFKPFECVGTFDEVKFAITKTIDNLEIKNENLPFLLQYYKDNFKPFDLSIDFTKTYNNENNLSKELELILKKELFG